MIIILIGVSGSGKSTIGKALAKELDLPFYDADDFHSKENKAKMHSRTPLTDADRKPWLKALRDFILAHGEMIMPCSALKHSYRRVLNVSDEVRFVYLKGSKELIKQRLESRKDHFFDPDLLDSQFRDLEEPKHALIIDVSLSVKEIVQKIKTNISTHF